MIIGFLALLICQLVGEFTVRALDLPIPGPLVGMIALLIVLQIRRPDRKSGVVRVADGLLHHLQLLFIPAGVGVIQYLPELADWWLPILGGLVIAWLATLTATAVTGAGILRLQARLDHARHRQPENPE